MFYGPDLSIACSQFGIETESEKDHLYSFKCIKKMPERGETEVFSNPLPPQNFEDFGEDDEGQHLTNEDFRKMLMTPRVSSSGSASSSTVHHGTKPAVTQHKKPVVPLPEEDEDDPATRRRKKENLLCQA